MDSVQLLFYYKAGFAINTSMSALRETHLERELPGDLNKVSRGDPPSLWSSSAEKGSQGYFYRLKGWPGRVTLSPCSSVISKDYPQSAASWKGTVGVVWLTSPLPSAEFKFLSETRTSQN